jgi:hypothetical protein
MEPKERFEDEDGGAWRDRLARWVVPEAPARLELRLRDEVRRRRQTAVLYAWMGRAALVALAVGAALTVRVGDGDRAETAAGVAAADLDLSGFQPVSRLRLGREDEVVTEAALDGFVPVGKMTLTKWEGRP